MKHNWFYISLVVALTVTLVVVWDTPPKLLIPFGDGNENVRLFPYAVIENAQSKHFDPDGHLSYEFVATTLRHYRLDMGRVSDGDYTDLETPRFTLYAEQTPWYVTADNGKLSERGAVLTLWPNVRIWQERDPNQVTELTTTQLRIRPKEKLVSTDAAVEITSAQGKIAATGMQVNLQDKRIELLSRVRGYHEPTAQEVSTDEPNP